MNKKTINSYFYFYLYAIFIIYFLFFIYIFGLGPDQPTWAGLDPAQPGQRLKPVTGWADD